ncbi:hypothetical protein E3P86_00903 [Wallemia ichthyophaga]|uniref:chitin deacetylase n=1 Tax=Wallemia ichthyophaga TaxID=245174 RepID=A0A4T0JAI2_WALIC|nr:hypothetical protein E3P86_00903 [Wallemia ichthyophaga]
MILKNFAYLSLLGLASAQSASVTDMASAAQSTDPTEECQPYSADIVNNIKDQFPEIWKPATIVDGDDDAQQKYNEIKQVIPSNIQPKGTHDGDFSNTTPDYDASDPDCWFTYDKCTSPKIDGLAEDFWKAPEPNTWSLGFDDGPNCSHNTFYNFLSDNDLTATMFYIGSNVMNWPYQAQRGVEDGHQICLHTWSHHYMTSFDDEGAFAELYYPIKAIKAITGVTPTCWRPPFGDVDDRIRIIAEGLGLRTALWEYDTNDWKIGTEVTPDKVEQNYQDVIDAAKNGTFDDAGTIVLTHEITGPTMDMFMKMFPKIRDAFEYVVPFYAARNITNLYVGDDDENTGETFAEYVSDVYNGTSVEAATSTNSNEHPPATVTGTNGALATVANPTVASIEGASATDIIKAQAASTNGNDNTDGGGDGDEDGDSSAFSFGGSFSLASGAALMLSTAFVTFAL